MSDPVSIRPIGRMRMTPDRGGVLHVEEYFDTTPEDLWNAITEPARVARWFAEVTGDRRVGGVVKTRIVSGWEGESVIERCDAPHALSMRTVATDDAGGLLEVRLVPEGDGTRLIVEDGGFEAAELPEHTAGWHAHLDDLAAYLAENRDSAWRARWQQLIPTYAAMTVDDA